MIWEVVENLGDKILYISCGLCFAEKNRIQGKGNRIYFPKFYGKGGVYYSLETKEYHSVGGDYSNKISRKFQKIDMIGYKPCTWVKLKPESSPE